MNYAYRRDARKRRTNLTLNEDLVRAAREMGMNISGIAEAALAAAVRERAKTQWETENTEAIRAHNDRVAKHGTFGDLVRRF